MIVVDASIIIAHVLGEDAAVERANLIETLRQGQLVAPAHSPAEISEQNLTAYDAAYVILAMELEASIATLDKAMRQAAGRLNLNVLPV